jgi:non-ribosomal peptide synthetase component E (peptide arylation enzyme)
LGGAGIQAGWGLTEFPVATTACWDDTDEELDASEGRAVPGVEVRVVAAEGRLCGPGEEGELRVRGPQMFAGYADPSLDAGAWDDDGFFRSGDLGVLGPRGHVIVTGRIKDVIIRNAENISAKEVEDVLVTHPAIADVAVIGLPDARTGERCCAVVLVADGADAPTLTELAEHCRAAGLATQKIPEQLELVDAIPRNPMGKVLKHQLRDRYRAANPAPG